MWALPSAEAASRRAPMDRTFKLLLAATLVAGCSGPIFGVQTSDHGGGLQRERGPTTEELLAIDVDTLPMSAEGAESLRQLERAVERARDEVRADLQQHRGELLVDFLQAHDAWDDVDPARGEWYAAAAGILVGVDAASPEFAARAVEQVSADMGAEAALVATSILEGRPLSEGAPASRLAISRLTHASEVFESWSRYAESMPLGAPPTESSLHVLSAAGLDSVRNRAIAGSLEAVAAAVETAAVLDTPLARAVDGVAAELAQRLAAAAVPLDLPTTLVADDVQLSPPHAFRPVDDAGAGGLGFTFRRVLIVRTTGIRLVLRPHASWTAGGLELVGASEGWLPPGSDILAFDGPGAIPPSAIEDGSVPAVEEALVSLESLLTDAAWLPLEETRRETGSVGVSVIADGDTYFSTLRPILAALFEEEYGPIALHTVDTESQLLDAVAVRLVAAVAVHDNVITVREDGYLVAGYDPENLRAPSTISRVAPGALVTLHRAIVQGFEDGTLDPEQPLTVRVDDNTVDFGVLAHLLAAVSFAREGADAETDAALLRSPIVESDGTPQVLAPRGLRLSL